jgi:putative membrane protein insertion efficiency factor
MTSKIRRMACAPIRLYQLVFASRPPQCRYFPSCSQYAIEAIERHGVLRGTGLAARRLLRCHPWAGGGVDHVPDAHRNGLAEQVHRGSARRRHA